MNKESEIQGALEKITTEASWGGLPYSNNHFYQHEGQYCRHFGCGRRLSHSEAICGDFCQAHSNPAEAVDVTKFLSY